MSNKKIIRQIIAVAFWVTAWFIIAYIVDNKLLIASPKDTLFALIKMAGTSAFYISVARSLARILLGFLVGFVMAGILAVLSYKMEMAKYIISPFVGLCKSMPVAVFSVVLIIWWGPENLSFFISMVVVLPVIFNNVLEGLNATDIKMLEMAQVFRIPLWNKAMFVYRPALKAYILSAVKSAIGMSWKAGVAAEVIGLTNKSIGGSLYTSKVYFNTDEVFAWAVVVILVSLITEKIIVSITKCLLSCNVFVQKKNASCGTSEIRIENLSKAFDGNKLYENYNAHFQCDKENIINQKSGSGKTTLLKMIAGLEAIDSGVITSSENISMVFQEDRLCEDYSAIDNVCIIGVSREKAKESLAKVLDSDCLDKPCKELSGGMKRRVAIVRALEHPSDILLMDEPFTGMDEGTIKRVKEYIEEAKKSRTVIVATHIL